MDMIAPTLAEGLARYACHPAQTRGRLVAEPESTTRSVFQRDRDRVIHSGAFRKLQYKTQVFVYHEGDYYRTRLTHSIEVAQIARSICRALRLDEDLAEALALAHDLGHTCFGHAGEDALDACMEGHGGFDHNDQALRIVTSLERRYAAFDGLNLTWETLEGLVKHNGPVTGSSEEPLPETIGAFNAKWNLELDTFASAEAQVAALSDDIAYNNHDIDDGLRAGAFTIDDLLDLPVVGPVLKTLQARYPGLEQGRLVHEAIRMTINEMVTDVIDESRKRLEQLDPASPDDIRRAHTAMIGFSSAMELAQCELKAFLMKRMYRHYRVNRMVSRAKRVVSDLFTMFIEEPQCLPPDWRAESGHPDSPQRRVADYIAGMTDRYALHEHQRLFDLYAPAL